MPGPCARGNNFAVAAYHRPLHPIPLPPLVLLRLDRARRGGVGVLSEGVMRFSLRTLIVVMLLAPVALALLCGSRHLFRLEWQWIVTLIIVLALIEEMTC